MPAPLHVTVLLGVPSAEREVSFKSGRAVAEALRSLGHQVNEVDPQDPSWKLPTPTDVVFIALHGTYGEDGTVQQRLENEGVPYTGCGPAASRTAFDKLLTKEACRQAGLATPPYKIVDSSHAPWPAGWTPPVVLKPVRQGSSVGLRFIDRVEQWPDALAEAFRYDQQVFIEPLVAGREATVGILDDTPLPPVEVQPHGGRYDYAHKYTPGATDYYCPARFDESTTRRVQETGLAAFQAIGGRHYARVDLIVPDAGPPRVLEVNTLPGMTETSLFPKAAAVAGIDFPTLCQRMIDLALRDRAASGEGNF